MGMMVIVAALIGGTAAFLAFRRAYLPWTALLDCVTGLILGAIIGGRALHVILNEIYFRVHPDGIIRLDGLEWRGAVIGGLMALLLIAHLHRLPLPYVTDWSTPLLSLMALAGCMGCTAGGCLVGTEVRSLADFPSWLVVETPDIYTITAPRLNLPGIGAALCAMILFLLIAAFELRLLKGGRMGLCLLCLGLVMGGLSIFRAEYVPIWGGLRADAVLDLFLAGFGLGALLWSQVKSKGQVSEQLPQSPSWEVRK